MAAVDRLRPQGCAGGTDGKHQLPLRDHIVSYGGPSTPLPQGTAHPGELNLQPQGVPREHLLPKAESIEAGEEGHLAMVLRDLEEHHGTYLGKSLHDQHSRHHFEPWKVALELGLVGGDRLDPNCPYPLLQLDYPVH